MAASTPQPFQATVLDAFHVTPKTRRILLGGPELRGFALPAGAWGPYLKLCLPRPDGCLARRTYSVRRFDPARIELVVDVLLHEPRGLASGWAAAVRPGAGVTLYGPGCLPVPAMPCWTLLAGDASALPAIAYTLENLPCSARGLALLALDDPADRQEIAAPPGVEVRWIEGDLAGAVASAPWVPDGTIIWAGAEAGTARALRAFARKEKKLEQDRRPILNYWKRGQAEGDFAYTD